MQCSLIPLSVFSPPSGVASAPPRDTLVGVMRDLLQHTAADGRPLVSTGDVAAAVADGLQSVPEGAVLNTAALLLAVNGALRCSACVSARSV